MGEPSEKDGSFSVPTEQPTRHFTDAEVRRNYEYILTSTNLYPPELHSAVRSVLSEPPLNPDWSDKGRQIAALFTPYGDREYQGDLLYRTRLHGEDGISFFFDEGYTYIPWNGLAFLLDAMIEDGDYPNPVVEEQPDPIGDYNIPDEVDEMGGPHRQMTIGEADFDYVLDAVAYEAGETVVEPVKPQAIVQMENNTPAAGDEPASVPDENPPVVVEAPETALPTDTAEQPTPPPVKGNTTAHKNFRRFQELFPEIVSGQYEYLRLEAGEAYYPLVIHHKYGSHYCMEHYYMQNGDRMYDPYMDFQIDKEAGTLRAFSYENSGIGVYNEADPDDPAYEKAINGFNSFFATWLNNIRSQGYEPVRASMMVNDEEVDVDLRPAAEAVPVVEEEQPEQLSLLSLEKSTEDLLVERVMQRGPLTAGKKEQIYEFAQTHPTGSEFTTFLKKLYGYEGFSGDEMGVKYAMFNSEGVTIEWQDEQGETQETKLSWARAAGVVQRLVDEGRYEKKEREPLVLPEKADNMKRAYWYLVSVRGISPKIVSHFMNRKMIYQEKKYGNCVFVGYDAEGTARYCSMRAARDNSSFKMDATGSDKSYPFFHEGKTDLLIVTEAPIDLMSHASIAADFYGRDWMQDHRIRPCWRILWNTGRNLWAGILSVFLCPAKRFSAAMRPGNWPVCRRTGSTGRIPFTELFSSMVIPRKDGAFL